MSRKLKGPLAALLLVLLTLPGQARAQSGTATSIDSNLLWLPAGPSELVTLRSTDLAPHLQTLVGGTVAYQHRPILLRSGGVEYEAVGNQLGADIVLAMGLFDRLQVGAAIPITLVQAGVLTRPITTPEDPRSQIHVVVLRDMRFALDLRVLARRGREGGLGLLLSAGLTAPTGNHFLFASSDAFGFVPALVADYGLGPVLISVDVSARIRTSTRTLGAARFGSNMVVRSGASWLMHERLSLSLEGGAVFELAEQSAEATEEQHAFEVGVGTRWQPGEAEDFVLRGALSLGAGGLGAPTFRVLIGFEQGARL